MKKLLFILFVLTFVISAQALIVETGSLRDFLYGEDSTLEYDNFVSHIAEGIASPNYNYYAPFDPQTTGFGDFITPNTTQLDNWSEITQEFLDGNWEATQDLLDNNSYPYHVVQFTDTDFDRTYYMLREILNDDTDANIASDPDDDATGSFDYGWGLYIYNPEASNPIIVTVPHPTDDFPTVVTGYHVFTKWDSSFLMITGAGREVKWTNVSPYYNSKSISDPTRNMNHPFNRSYQKFADYIRTEFGRLEFSAQMHSYDWNDRHNGYANTQISAGGNRPNPNLPIWDHSSNGQDLINWSNEVIFPANTFGVHEEVDRNDYYAVFNSVHDLYYDNDPTTPINTDVDLWGYSENRQMQYTHSGTTDNDIVDPFFHIEIDELPEVYEQTVANYWWFYGYDPTTAKFVPENIYTMTENYYTYWIDVIAEHLDSFIDIEADSPAPSMPMNFHTVSSNYNDVDLSWDPVSDHNFKSYQILYSDSPISGINYSIFDRENNDELADQKTNSIKVTGLNPDTDYYFQIRALDYSGNYSDTQEEISISTNQYKITSFTALNESAVIKLDWSTYNESELFGFFIYRRDFGSEEWSIVSDLIEANNVSGTSTYTYYDSPATESIVEYALNVFNLDNTYDFYYESLKAHASEFVTLQVSNADNSVNDSVVFGVNELASDSYESSYDTVTSTSGSGSYIIAAFYEQYYNSAYRYLEQDIYGNTDLTQNYKTYVLQVKSSLTNQQLKIDLSSDALNINRNSKKIWLKESSNNFIDLSEEPLYFTVSNSNFKSFTLYYGNLNPTLTISSAPAYEIYHPNDIINLQWSYQNNEMLDHYRLDLISETDSLNILDDVASNTYFFPWLVPFESHIEDAKFVITAFANDGEVRRYESEWSMGILPLEMTYDFNEGWQLVSHVWENEDPSPSDLFGPGTTLTQFMSDQSYSPTLFYNFGVGYWANIPTDFQSTNSLDIHQEDVTVDIHQGWNLLGNPYPSDLDLTSLLFNVDGIDYTIGEMITYGYISRGIYTHGENGYEVTDYVDGMEGFYLYSTLGEFNMVTLTYTPYLHHYGLDTLPVDWSAKIIAESNNDKDNICVGISDYATNNLDYNLDFPKAPKKPYEGIDIYTNYEDSDYSYGQQEFQATIIEDEISEWSFIVNARSLEAITLSFETEDFPTGSLFTAINFNGIDYTFNSEMNYEFTPTEIGEYQFTLKIANSPIGNDNGEVAPVTASFNIYPNPFNPETTIAFDLKNEGKVELVVYNLKGQKVKTICNETLTAGRKTFVWNGKNCNNRQTASGIYFMKLKAAGQKDQIRKIVLMK